MTIVEAVGEVGVEDVEDVVLRAGDRGVVLETTEAAEAAAKAKAAAAKELWKKGEKRPFGGEFAGPKVGLKMLSIEKANDF